MRSPPTPVLLGVVSLLWGLLASSPVSAQEQGVVAGRVVGLEGTPVPYAEIVLRSGRGGWLADGEGRFRIPGVPHGAHTLLISAQGFGVEEVDVRVGPAGVVAAGPAVEGGLLTIVLAPDPVALEALTVTGTMKNSTVASSPVKVSVVPQAVLQRNATNNLVEAISFVNGLYQQVDCGVCYTNNLRINGMEGPYTAVLVDGMPIMSSLASVYGLNGINPALIEQVEIVKGPSSTLYGSEAMAGVINVITKDPRFAPRFVLDASGTSDAEGNVDFALSSEPGETSALLSGNVAYNRRFVDENGDGFTDFPLNRRAVVFGKADWTPDGRPRATVSAKYLYEDRFGGVEEWTPAHRGSDRVYGESIYTNRIELLGSYRPSFSDEVRVEASYAWHDQDSWYGDSRYDASQHVGFVNALWGPRLGRHDLLLGVSARYQSYDDNTPATRTIERRVVPGVLVQDEVRFAGGQLTALGGLRADWHDHHGSILSPRIALKWDLASHTTVRVNGGTGFRVVNLFTEDHAALTGSRDVVIPSELEPERSRSVTLNVNQVIEFGPNPMMIDVDVFRTRFSNKIVPDYDADPNLIVYENLRGHAVSRGVSVSLNQNVDFDRFLYSVGVTFQDVYTEEDAVREDEFFAPAMRGVLSATYNARRIPLRFDYTGSITGPMRLPRYDEPFTRPDRSPSYALHNAQVTWRATSASEVYLSIRNLLDFRQPSPLVDPGNPFGDAFDTSYVYGPMRGRSFMLGVRYGVTR